MSDDGLIRIKDEDQAWEVLRSALAGELSVDSSVQCEGWPFVTIHLPVAPHSSISPSMMEAFLELQRSIYRAHTFLSSDTGDLRTLSRVEKDRFEFHVRVSNGSSGYEVNLTEILKSLGVEALSKMSSVEVIIIVVVLALIFGGVITFKAWLKAKAEQRSKEIESEDKKNWLNNYQAQLEHDTKRIELLVSAIERQPVLGEVDAAVDSARTEIVKAIGDERGGKVQGVELPQEVAAELTAQKRQQGTDVRIAGNYRVSKVDTTVADGFRVTLADVSTGEEISASLLDVFVSAEHRNVIQKAEWEKTPIFVEMKARKLRKRTVDAVVINARPIDVEATAKK